MTDYNWPTNFVPTSSALTWHDNSIAFISPLSGQVRTESRPGGRWKLQLTLEAWKNETDPASGRVSVHELEAFLYKLNGTEHRAVIPDHSYARLGTGTGGLVNGAGQTGKSIITDNWPTGTKIFYAGDRFTLDGQMHVITADVTTDGSGNATLPLAHPHRTATTNNAGLNVGYPTARYYLTNKVGFSNAPGVFKSVMLEFEEAIP